MIFYHFGKKERIEGLRVCIIIDYLWKDDKNLVTIVAIIVSGEKM